MNLTTIAIISIGISIICAVAIIIDLVERPQKMWIMNIVWPVTALYSGPLGLFAYFTIGRNRQSKEMSGEHQMHQGSMEENPMWQSVLKGALHCGGGCTLGDLIGATGLLFIPVVVFSNKLYGEWLVEFILAFVLGIIFQYYAIKPMKNLKPKDGIIAALKADTLSLICWQIGMYGWMAICDFLIFHQLLKASNPVFWLMMQIGMLAGLLTAYPINWWLIKIGIKERM